MVLANIPVSPFSGWFSRLSLYVSRLLPQWSQLHLSFSQHYSSQSSCWDKSSFLNLFFFGLSAVESAGHRLLKLSLCVPYGPYCLFSGSFWVCPLRPLFLFPPQYSVLSKILPQFSISWKDRSLLWLQLLTHLTMMFKSASSIQGIVLRSSISLHSAKEKSLFGCNLGISNLRPFYSFPNLTFNFFTFLTFW